MAIVQNKDTTKASCGQSRRERADAAWLAAANAFAEGRSFAAARLLVKSIAIGGFSAAAERLAMMSHLAGDVVFSRVRQGGPLLRFGDRGTFVLRRIARDFAIRIRTIFIRAALKRRTLPDVWFLPLSDGFETSLRGMRSIAFAKKSAPRAKLLEKGQTPPPDDYVLPLFEGDEIYPEAVAELLRAAANAGCPDVVYADHAWNDGAGGFRACCKPFIAADCVFGSFEVVCGAAMFKASALKSKTAASSFQVRKILMNRAVPFNTPFDAPLAPSTPNAEPPLVSVIIPTRDHVELLRECVESMRARTDYPRSRYEIIIVDNGSRDPATLEYLHECGAKVIRHDKPFNFSELNNIGARAATGELLLFLNSDIAVPSSSRHWLSALVAAATVKNFGIAGALLRYPCGALQHAGVGLFQRFGGLMASNTFAARMDQEFWARHKRECLAVTGACQLVRRETFDAIGGYDEAFPVVYNDIDFCLRARDAGWRAVFEPAAELIHCEGISGGADRVKVAATRESCELFNNRWSAKIASDPFLREEWMQ